MNHLDPVLEQIITVKEASQVSGLSPRQLRFAADRGNISVGWFGHSMVLLRPEVEELAQKAGKR